MDIRIDEIIHNEYINARSRFPDTNPTHLIVDRKTYEELIDLAEELPLIRAHEAKESDGSDRFAGMIVSVSNIKTTLIKVF